MVHMRAQLLRIEQEKELMQNRLEEETAEREKAQKQVGRTTWGLGWAGHVGAADGGGGAAARRGRTALLIGWQGQFRTPRARLVPCPGLAG